MLEPIIRYFLIGAAIGAIIVALSKLSEYRSGYKDGYAIRTKPQKPTKLYCSGYKKGRMKRDIDDIAREAEERMTTKNSKPPQS